VVLEEGVEDDEAYATLADVLDGLEQELRAAGFVLAMQTGMALLGVRLLDALPPAAPHELLELARELHRRATDKAAGSRVSVHACVHVDQVNARHGPDGLEITGGPLADIAGWALRSSSGFSLTPSASRACVLPLKH
ncbi:MAG TPA: serine/threonine protein kinase, partial [Myxococcaceae bacterium]|nr:serine/threonine protein kinase [Myxococcaceae bacterium]